MSWDTLILCYTVESNGGFEDPVMWSDFLSEIEVHGTRIAAASLAGVPWAASMVKPLEQDAWWTVLNKSHMFEVRFAAELNACGCEAHYEYDAGVGGKTIDFCVQGGQQQILVELVSIGESDAVNEATDVLPLATAKPSSVNVLQLSTDSGESSEEGEYVLVQQKILEKVEKFAKPVDRTIQIILVDIRGFCGVGNADAIDLQHIVYGASGLQEVYVRRWKGKPIQGLFELNNPLRKVRLLHERIHFIGFANESRYTAGELRDPAVVRYYSNPLLISNDQLPTLVGAIPFGPVSKRT